MPQQIIAALVAAGWTIDVIAVKTGISIDRLRSCRLKSNDMQKLLHCAELAKIDVDGEEEDE